MLIVLELSVYDAFKSNIATELIQLSEHSLLPHKQILDKMSWIYTKTKLQHLNLIKTANYTDGKIWLFEPIKIY